jgi:hypothetical protein
MTSRAASELLLVASLPAPSSEVAFRAGAELFGDLVFALPDGETGPRAAWVGYEREALVGPNPDVVVVEETESPTGRPRHACETPVFAIREGATEAIASSILGHESNRTSRPRTSRASSRGPTRERGSGLRARSRGSRGSSPKVTRLTRLVPEEVLVGYHLCYGTFPEWPMYEARDYSVLV